MCKFTTDAIITDGSAVGTVHKVCANPACPVHHPKPQTGRDDIKWKAEQEKQRREAAIANTTGIRVLAAIAAAVPVRLMKRDLLFVVERLASLLDENRLALLARKHGIKKVKDVTPSRSGLSPISAVKTKARWAACWSQEPSCVRVAE